MKRVFFILLLCVFCAVESYSQEGPPPGAIMIDEKTVFKNESGELITFEQFNELMSSGEWGLSPVNDKDGTLLYLQLHKASEEEKKMMAEMSGMNALEQNQNVGQQIPDFKMEDLDGNKITSENTKGKVLVLNFWFTTCKPCLMEIPELNEVYEKYKSNPEVVFASITFSSEKEVEQLLKKYPLDYPKVVDAEKICKEFDIKSYPTNIIIDKNGKISQYINGGFPQIGDVISDSIEKALSPN